MFPLLSQSTLVSFLRERCSADVTVTSLSQSVKIGAGSVVGTEQIADPMLF